MTMSNPKQTVWYKRLKRIHDEAQKSPEHALRAAYELLNSRRMFGSEIIANSAAQCVETIIKEAQC